MKTKLYESYPDRIVYGGKRYRLDLSWDNVLRTIDVFSDPKISDEIQLETALDNLVIRRHPVAGKLLDAIFMLIFPKNSGGEQVIDFKQDADLIAAGFRQAYGIDLKKNHMHWCEFMALLKGLPKSTRMAEVIDIRQRPIPQPTKYNAEERAALIRAKASVAIKKENSFEKGLLKMYETLSAQAKGG